MAYFMLDQLESDLLANLAVPLTLIIMNTLKTLIRYLSPSTLILSFALSFNTQAEDKSPRGQLSAKDYKFACDVSEGGAMEVMLGRLASEKAANPGVKEFGQRMIKDHQKANDELTKLLTQKGATLVSTSTKKEEKTTDALKKLEGNDFDKAYIKDMVKDHKKDVKEFQKESEKAEDTDLKNWVTSTLPVLQEHLRMAENLEATLTGTKPQAKRE